MPTTISLSFVVPLIVDGLLFSIGFTLGSIIINGIIDFFARRRTPA